MRGELKDRIAELEAECAEKDERIAELITESMRLALSHGRYRARLAEIAERFADDYDWTGVEHVCRRCGEICSIEGDMPEYFATCDWCNDYAGGFDGGEYARRVCEDIADSRPKQ